MGLGRLRKWVGEALGLNPDEASWSVTTRSQRRGARPLPWFERRRGRAGAWQRRWSGEGTWRACVFEAEARTGRRRAGSGEGRPRWSPARVGEEEPGAFTLAVERRRLGRGGVRQGAAMAESDEGAARRRRLGSSTAAGSGDGRPRRGPARGSHGGVGRGAEDGEGAAGAVGAPDSGETVTRTGGGGRRCWAGPWPGRSWAGPVGERI